LFGMIRIRGSRAPLVDLCVSRRSLGLIYLLFVLSLLSTSASAARSDNTRPRVVFLNPATPENIFWEKVTRLMRHGAQQLDMDLTVSYQTQEDITSRFSYVKAANDILSAENPPDYLLFLNLRDTGHRILEQAEAVGVKSMMILSDIHDDERLLFGEPRGKFRHWIGHLVSDDHQAGYLLADRLLTMARKLDRSGVIETVGINGSINGTAAALRAQGLKQALAEHERSSLNALVNSRTWLRQDGQAKALVLLRRHPGTEVIWAASDGLALGASDAAAEIGGGSAGARFVGGIDWTDEALEAVTKGQLTLSVGGHVLESLIALVLLHDHYHGRDFNRDPGARLLTPMAVADRRSAAQLQKRMNADLDAVNIQRLSKVRDHTLERYDFSIANILSLPQGALE